MIAFSPTARPLHTPHPGRLQLVPPVGRPVAAPHVPPSTYRRRQALAAGFVATVVAVVSMVLGSLGDGSRSVPELHLTDSEAVTYIVQPGDTLWSIAARLDPGGDPRPLVERLAFENGGPRLRAGEMIAVPAA